MKAYLKNYRQSPRKVRLVTELIKGRRVADALVDLQFLPKRASKAISKLIASAAANAENNFKVDAADLMVREIRVDEGVTMKRFNPVSRGRAHRINKRTSHVMVTLSPVTAANPAKKTAQKEVAEKAPAKKSVAKKPAAAKKETKPKAAAKKPTAKKPVTKKAKSE